MSRIDDNNRTTILLMAAALLIIVIAGILIAGRISRPILRVHASALALAKGDWLPPVHGDSSIAEVNGLTESFDYMAARLRETLERLSREVADRIRTEDALRESEEQYRTLVENAAEIVFRTDDRGRFTLINPASLRITGYPEEELIGAHYTMLIRPDLRDEAVTFFTRQFAERIQGTDYRFPIVTKEGREVWLSQNPRLILEEGRVQGFQAIARDITAIKQAEEELANQRWRLASIIEGTNAGTWEWNVQTGETTVNERWARIIGYTLAELAPVSIQTWISLTHPDDLKRSDELLQRHFSGELPYCDRECRMQHKDGHWVWVLARGRVITRTDEGMPLMMFGTHLDISERKRSEEERLRLTRRLEQIGKSESLANMSGGIAHHLNNMLGAVMGNLELALNDLPEGSESRRSVSEALKASTRAAEIGRFMLTYLGQTQGRKEHLDLARLVGEVRALLGASLPGNVRLETELPSRGPMVQADGAHLKQILENLVSNAVEAIGEGEGHITVTVDESSPEEIGKTKCFPVDWAPKEGSYARVSVVDTGQGLDAATIDKIFDPFFTTRFMGRGLGLPTVLGLLRIYEGAISVESSPGEGSIFRVYFPKTAQAELPLGEERPAPGRIEDGGLILLVDDEPMVRDMARKMLDWCLGCDVLTAADGQEALEIFRAHRDEIRLVLLDLTMPGMDGWQTLAGLRALRPDIPVILASGYDEAQVMRADHAQRPQAFLHKPYRMMDLKAAVGPALGCPHGR